MHVQDLRRGLGLNVLVVLSLSITLVGQGATLLTDIHTIQAKTPRSSSRPAEYAPLGSGVVFAATNITTGRELFFSGGTPATTRLVRDLNPGVADSNPQHLNAVGGVCYFSAATVTAGRELWKTNGTAMGTVMLKDLAPGIADSNPQAFTVLGGTMYFLLGDGSYNLCKTDGTSAGTVLVKSMGTASGPTDVAMAAAGNRLYFGAPNLWISDGTPAGTAVLSSSVQPLEFAVVGPVAFTSDALRLYKCTPAGITPLAYSSSGIDGLVVAGPHVYFTYHAISYTSGYPVPFTTLWRADATAARWFVSSPYGARVIEVSGGSVYFQAPNGPNQTTVYRNTTSNVHLAVPSSKVLHFRAGDVYYAARGILYRYVAASKATLSIGQFDAGDEWFELTSGTLLFAARDPKLGEEPHRTDGTAANTGLLADLEPTPPGGDNESSDPQWLYDAAGLVYFSAIGNGIGRELFVTDGTAAGTRLVRDIEPGSGDSKPHYFAMLGDHVLFAATPSTAGTGIWTTDGTGSGTRLLRAIQKPSRLTTAGGYVFFQALGGGGRYYDLWRTDGTSTGTVRVQSLNDWYAHPMHAVGNALFYPVGNGGLWRVQGAGLPSQVVGGLVPNDYLTVGDVLYFGAIVGSGRRLGRVDASGANLAWIVDMVQAGGSFVEYLYQAHGKIYMWSMVGRDRYVFATDGTQNGTARLPVTHSGGLLGAKFGSVASQGLLRRPGEIFVSNGTVANTKSVKKIWNHAGTSDYSNWSNFAIPIGDRRVYFAEDDGWSGVELWVSDGTANGTHRVADTNVGSADGQYTWGDPALSNGRLVFAAQDLHRGGEPWVVDVGAVAQSIGFGCATTAVPPRLTADDPILGASVTVRLEHAGPNQNGVFAIGAPSPGFRHTHLGGGCTFYFDLTAPLYVGFNTDAAGRFTLNAGRIPNLPILQGARIVLQSGTGPSAMPPLGTDLSNGVLMVLGR